MRHDAGEGKKDGDRRTLMLITLNAGTTPDSRPCTRAIAATLESSYTIRSPAASKLGSHFMPLFSATLSEAAVVGDPSSA